MVYRSVRHEPPRGSTEWGARQFRRLLDDEERIAAERERLRAMGWRPPRAAAVPLSNQPSFGDERDAYADLIEQDLTFRRALTDEARRRAKDNENGISAVAEHGSPDWVGGTRFATPMPERRRLIRDVLLNEKPSGPGGGRQTIPLPWFSDRAPEPPAAKISPAAPEAIPAPALSRETAHRNLIRGYTGERGELNLPPGYVPRYYGLNDEMGTRQATRAAAYESLLQQRAWDREKALELIESGDDNGSLLSDVWDGLVDVFTDDAPIDPPPAAAARVAGEAARVQRIVEAFSDAGIFLWESPETRQDNLDIIEMIKQEARACGAEARHHAGAGKRERIIRPASKRLKGSRRTDGTTIIAGADGHEYFYDFNTVDTRSDGSLTRREATARSAILALKRRVDADKISRFDTYRKSRGRDRKRWRKEVRPLVRNAVRALLNC